MFLLTIKIFKDDGNLFANVTFPYKTLTDWSGLMSETQQGPEICDVVSTKRFCLKIRLQFRFIVKNHWDNGNVAD